MVFASKFSMKMIVLLLLSLLVTVHADGGGGGGGGGTSYTSNGADWTDPLCQNGKELGGGRETWNRGRECIVYFKHFHKLHSGI